MDDKNGSRPKVSVNGIQWWVQNWSWEWVRWQETAKRAAAAADQWSIATHIRQQVKHLPRLRMGSTRVECHKKGIVRQIKALGGNVSQNVGTAQNVEALQDEVMGTLVEAGGAEQVGLRARGGDGVFGTPCDGWCIVIEGGYSELTEVVVGGQGGYVTDGGGEFQVGIGDGATGFRSLTKEACMCGGKGSCQT